MAANPQHFSPAEYLAWEREQATKHEYLDGVIVAMVGASEHHNLLQVNLIVGLTPQVRRQGCRLYGSDLRVRIPNSRFFTYPDLSISCGTPQFEAEQSDVLLNPTVIIEILSPSTATYDRTAKFARYRQIPSLREYILVAQDSVFVEQFVRQPDDRWLWSAYEALTDTLALASVDATIALADLYADIAL